MSTVERRVLELVFDNTRFERAVRTSMSTLSDLRHMLEMKNATDGLDQVERKLNRFSFRGMHEGLSNLSEEFNSFGKGFSDRIDELAAKIDNSFLGKAFGGIRNKFDDFSAEASYDLDAIQAAEKDFNFDHMSSGIDALGEKFSALSIIGITALGTLASRATDWLIDKATALPSMIFGGGYQRAQNIENARFTMQGILGDAEKVEAAMQIASDSVYNTAYSLDQAAMASSMFIASGMDIEYLDEALGALAGTAATANADYGSMANIFTTIYGQGRIMGDQLNQLARYGIGAAADLRDAFQMVVDSKPGANLVDYGGEINQQIRDAYYYGVENIEGFLDEAGNITEHGIRELVSAGLIGADTFLAIYNKRYGEHAKDAQETFTGSIANMKAALARIGELFFTGLIQQNGPLVKLFNTVRTALNGVLEAVKPVAEMWTNMVNTLATGANKALTAFIEHGGFEAIGNILQGFVNILGAIGYAIRDAFNLDGEGLFDLIGKLTDKFKKFTESLEPSEKTLERLRGVLTTVGKIFKTVGLTIQFVFKLIVSAGKIVFKILSPVFDLLKQFGGFLKEQLGRFADWIASMSEVVDTTELFKKAGQWLSDFVGKFDDWIDKLYAAIRQSHIFETALDGLRTAYEWVRDVISSAVDSLKEFIDKVSSGAGKTKEYVETLQESVTTSKKASKAQGFFGKVLEKLRGIVDSIKKAFPGVIDFFKGLGSKISAAFKSIDWDNIFTMENLSKFAIVFGQIAQMLLTGEIVGIFDNFRQLVGAIPELFTSIGESVSTVGTSVSEFLDGLGKSATAISTGKLIGIAIAIGILALALKELAKLNIKQLGVGLAGIFGLLAMMTVLMYIGSGGKGAKGAGKGKGLKERLKGLKGTLFEKGMMGQILVLSAAIYILASALAKIGQLDPKQMWNALGVITVLMIVLSGFMLLFTEEGGLKGIKGILHGVKMPNFLSLLAVAGSVYILGMALARIAEIPKDRLWEAVGVLAVLTLLMGVFTLFTGAGSFGGGAGAALAAIGVAGAMWLLARVIVKFGEMDQSVLEQGLLVVAALMLILTVLLQYGAQPKTGGANAGVALAAVGVAVSLEIFAHVIERFGKMNKDILDQGLLVVAALMLILTVVLKFGGVPKSGGANAGIALAAVGIAIALEIFAHVIKRFGEMDKNTLIQGGIAVGVIMTVLAIILGVLSKTMAKSFNEKGSTTKLLGISAAFVLLSFAIGIIALALSALAVHDWDSILNSGIAVAMVFGVMGIVIGVMTSKLGDVKRALAIAGVMIVLSFAIGIVAVALSALAFHDWSSILAAAAAVSIVFAVLAIAVGLLTKFTASADLLKTAASFIILAFAVDLIAAALFALALVDPKHLAIAVGALVVVLAALIVAGWILSKPAFALGFGLLASGLLAIGAGCFLVGAGIALAVGSFALLFAVLGLLGPMIVATIYNLITLIPYFGQKVAEGIGAFCAELGTHYQDISDATYAVLGGFADGVGRALADLPTTVIPNLVQAIENTATEIENNTEAFYDACDHLGEAVWNFVKEGIKRAFKKPIEIVPQILANPEENPIDASEHPGAAAAQQLIHADQPLVPSATQMTSSWGGGSRTMPSVKPDTKSANEAGRATVAAYANGMTNSSSAKSAALAGQEVGQRGVTGASQLTPQYRSVGMGGSAQYVGGVRANNYAGAYGAGSAMTSQVKSGAGNVSLYGTGVSTGEGYAIGIRATIGRVSSAAGTIANVAKATLKAFLGIRSPSKVFAEYGMYTGQGFANGMVDSVPVVSKATEIMGKASINTIQEAFSGVFDVVDDLLDISDQPTITPVVDLSNVTAAKNQLMSMFPNSPSFGMLGGLTQSVARSFASRESVGGLNKVTDTETSINSAYERAISVLETRDELMAEEIKGLREDVQALEIRLDSGELVGGLVSNSRRRAAMNV